MWHVTYSLHVYILSNILPEGRCICSAATCPQPPGSNFHPSPCQSRPVLILCMQLTSVEPQPQTRRFMGPIHLARPNGNFPWWRKRAIFQRGGPHLQREVQNFLKGNSDQSVRNAAVGPPVISTLSGILLLRLWDETSFPAFTGHFFFLFFR